MTTAINEILDNCTLPPEEKKIKIVRLKNINEKTMNNIQRSQGIYLMDMRNKLITGRKTLPLIRKV